MSLEDARVDSEDLFAQLSERATAAGLQVARRDHPDELGDIEGFFVELTFPAGPDSRTVSFHSERLAEVLLQPFEGFRMLRSFDAFYSLDGNWIESLVSTFRGLGTPVLLFRRIFRDEDIDIDGYDLPTVSLESNDVLPVTVEFGSPTVAGRMLGSRFLSRASLRILNARFSSHDEAEAVLLTLSNSLFYDLDAKYGVPLTLSRPQSRVPLVSARSRSAGPPRFPISRYDPEPLALFSYARSARRMPLLQFLAFYQCIEFYFDVYSRQEAVTRIGTLLKDPSFSPHNERDVARVLAAIQGTGRAGFGSEKVQLQTVLTGSVHEDDLRAYLDQVSDAAKMFLSKKSPLTDVRIATANKSLDVREVVADRIYDIRCRIVHSKDSPQDPRKVLLPFSPEETLLEHDLALVEFLARRVLSHRATPLRVQGVS